MLRIDLTMIPSAATLISGLSRFSGDIRSVRVPLERAIDEVVRPAIRENFAGEEARGVPWQRLSESRRISRGSRHPILVAPPHLREGGPHLRQVAQQKNIWEFDEGQAGQTGYAFIPSLPENVFYGEFHHRGEGVPERMFFVIDNNDLDKIEEIFNEWIGERATVRLG